MTAPTPGGGSPHALGRRLNHDPRSRNYPFSDRPESELPVVSVRWTRRAPILDQGQVGSCVGNAAAGWLGTDDRVLPGRADVTETLALELYSAATRADPFDGEYPPDDTGTDGTSVAKVLKQLGHIESYTHCFAFVDVLAALQSGPLITGTNWYECVVPGTRVLTAALEWLPIEKLDIGAALVGFDETAAGSACYRPATVLSADRIVRPCYEVTTDRGCITVSENHLFIRRHPKKARQWVRADALVAGDWLAYFGEPWEADRSWEAGWLAGFYDGEGSLASGLLTAAQLPGPTCDFALNLLAAKGYDVGLVRNHRTGVRHWYLRGEAAKCRFLGSVRPQRLLATGDRAWNGHRVTNRASRPAVVQNVRFVGMQEVVAVGTDQGTLITEGLLSHNSMFEPSPRGLVSISGQVAGGHEYVVEGVDVERRELVFANSWGPDWGEHGHFRMSYDTYRRLLGESGDATVLHAPVPAAPEPDPFGRPTEPWWQRWFGWLFQWTRGR